MPNRGKKVLSDEQQSSVDEVIVPSDVVLERLFHQIGVGMEVADGVRLEAIEKAVYELGKNFAEHRKDLTKGAWPRIEVLVDTNCLVTFTGPLTEFDKAYFMTLVKETIAGRVQMTEATGLALKSIPKEMRSISEVG